MYGIFMECLVALKIYFGTVPHMILFGAALIYLAITEKNKKVKLIMVYMPIIMILLFLCPLSRKLYVRLVDGETYYRLLWMIPFAAIVAYAGCRVLMRLHGAWKYVTTALMAAAVIITGTNVYSVPYAAKAENSYHIPQYVIDICDEIMPADGERDVYAAVPKELTFYVRQYTSKICLIYGRESVEPAWNNYDPIYEVMQGDETTGVIDTKKLITLTRETPSKQCAYIILRSSDKIDAPLEEQGLVKLKTISGYDIYEDPVAKKNMDDLLGQYGK